MVSHVTIYLFPLHFNSYIQVENFCLRWLFKSLLISYILRFFFLFGFRLICLISSDFSEVFVLKRSWSSSVPTSSFWRHRYRHWYSWRGEDEAIYPRPHSELQFQNLGPALHPVLLPQHIAFHIGADHVLANVIVERASDLKLEDLGWSHGFVSHQLCILRSYILFSGIFTCQTWTG